MANRVPTQCDQCGKTDTAPKVHIGTITKHNDCLSFSEKEMVVGSSDVAAQIIAECEGGLKDDNLLAKIVELHQEVI